MTRIYDAHFWVINILSLDAGSGRLLASWLQTVREQTGQTQTKRSAISLGYDHELFKRTDIYSVFMKEIA